MRCAVAVTAALVLLVGGAVAAGAASITSPTSPFNAPAADTAGNPDFFTVSATGYPVGAAVFVEQCDGVAPSAPQYSPSEHCDAATGQAPVFADGSGNATFLATDQNRRLIPFKGESPQGLFNCNALGETPPSNGLPNFTNCQIRVATQTGATTTDQAYIDIVLPAADTTTATPIGGCGGQVGLGTITPALTDQTQIGVVVKTKLLKNLTTKAAITGSCDTASRPGDPINPAGGAVSLHPKAMAASLLGNASCAAGSSATAADATKAAAWPLNGKITYTMTELNALAKPWQIQADVAILGFNTSAGPDVVDIGGIVLKGAAVGAIVGGNLWQDPVTKTGGATGYNTGYELDVAAGTGCADGTANNASISTVMLGGGGTSATSLLGSTATGPQFTLGE
jgi:hypothetical protein